MEDLEKEREQQREAEQALLDEEMKKRRERVRAWQEARAAKDTLHSTEHSEGVEATMTSEPVDDGSTKWTLDDEEEDESLINGDGETAAEVEGAGAVSVVGNLTAPETLQPLNPSSPPKSDPAMGIFSRLELSTKSPAGQNPKGTQAAVATIAPPHAPPATKKASRFAKKHLFDTASNNAAPQAVGGTTATTTTTAAAPAQIVPEIRAPSAQTEEEDALDSFMTSLLDSGEVAAQAALPSGFGNSARPTVGLSSIQQNKVVTADLEQGQNDAPLASDGDVTDEDFENDPTVNPFGTNYITLDEIMGKKGGSDGGNGEWTKGGWESDAPSPTPMDQGEKDREDNGGGGTEDEKEERERKEFFEALRRSHRLEEQNDEKAARREGVSERKREAIGRVFAGEGDVMDESEVEQKKKTALEILEEQKKGKELKPVDHSTIDYLPFRKNLYIVPRALARMSEGEIELNRQALQIKVRGRGCPAPVENWEQCGLSERILQVIKKHNFVAPFAIQQQALPAIMCGRDVIGVAKTGSGKTLAFLLPMFRHIMDQPPLREMEGPIGLIMAPARELAFQIYNEAKKFSKALGLRVVCVYGGAGVAEQIGELKRGADIVVCTPGRMIDILCMQAGKLVSLRRVTMVVMDEADRMFDMGFEPQIKMILQNIRPDRQTVLFSATFPKPIEKLAKTILKLPLEIVVGDRTVANKDIVQYVEVHEEEDKYMRLLQLLGVWYDKGSILIFVDKQEKCDQLFQDLLKSGYPCLSLHGGKDQIDRDHTLHEFKTLIKTVMVATSVAGRGLDVPEIVCVINYNCPNHLEEYVHRIGRTGRAGRKGTAYTFISPHEDQYSPIMAKALEKAGQPIPEELAAMVKTFQEKVDRGEAHYISTKSGFVGQKGFTFDASEMNEAQKLASMQRRAYEIEQGIISEKPEDDMGDLADDEFGDDMEDGFDNAEASSTTNATSASTYPGAPSASALAPPGGALGAEALLAAGRNMSANMTPLEKAMALASALSAGVSSTQPAVGAVPSMLPLSIPVPPPPPISADGKIDPKAALARAKLIAMQMTSSAAKGVGGKEEGKEAHYEEEFEINDYPHQVRYLNMIAYYFDYVLFII